MRKSQPVEEYQTRCIYIMQKCKRDQSKQSGVRLYVFGDGQMLTPSHEQLHLLLPPGRSRPGRFSLFPYHGPAGNDSGLRHFIDASLCASDTSKLGVLNRCRLFNLIIVKPYFTVYAVRPPARHLLNRVSRIPEHRLHS